MKWWAFLVASVVLGAASSTASAPLDLPYAMVVAVALWLACLLRVPDARTRTVAFGGALFGLGLMAPLIWWMRAVSDGAYVALVLAETPFFALLAVLLRRVQRRRWWPLWGAGVWVAIEWLRGSFPFSGFPWGRLVHTAIDTPFAPWVRLVGMPGTSAVMFVVAASIALAVVRLRPATVVRAAVVTAVVLGAGVLLPTGTADPGATRRVAVVQGDTPGAFLTWPLGEILQLHLDETRRLVQRIESGREEQPDFVLWPENATDVDPRDYPSAEAAVQQLVDDLGVPLLVGGIFDGPTDTTAYNQGVVWTGSGPGATYVKRKPVPYGEYVPFRQELGGLVPRFDRDIPRDMLPGKKVGALQLGSTTIGDTICWDIAYDGVVRDAMEGGAQVLVVQTSNAAFTGTTQPRQQWNISRLRAIETGRTVLVPSTNGISGVVDAHGRVVDEAPTQEPATISETVTLGDGLTPGVRFGGWVELLLGVVGVLAALLARPGRERTRPPEGAGPGLG